MSLLKRSVCIPPIRRALLCFFVCALANAEQQADSNNQPSSNDTANQNTSGSTPANASADPDPAWHANLNLYLWFPGTHGLIGNENYNVGYKASATDLLSNFRFGAMALLGTQRGRFVMLDDLIWVRLAGNKSKALPFPDLPELTAQQKAWELILTPEFGYRFLDGEKFKIDAIGGLRYWHLGSSLQFSPSLAGTTFSRSANWADPLMGARFVFPLSPKLMVTILGDAGGWGAGAQLDWQLLGAISLKLSPKWTLDAGYRYLYVDYRPGTFVYQSAMSGALLGVTYTLK